MISNFYTFESIMKIWIIGQGNTKQIIEGYE